MQKYRAMVVEVPEYPGYTCTGSYREPRDGDWVQNCTGTGLVEVTRDSVYIIHRLIYKKNEPEIRTGWINLYPRNRKDMLYSTKLEANECCDSGCFGCVKVSYEVPESRTT